MKSKSLLRLRMLTADDLLYPAMAQANNRGDLAVAQSSTVSVTDRSVPRVLGRFVVGGNASELSLVIGHGEKCTENLTRRNRPYRFLYMATTTETPGFSPDSAYASWSQEERESSDRMEAYFQGQRRTILAQAEANAGHPISYRPDESLRRLAKTWRRELEDVQCGDRNGGKRREALLKARLRDIEAEQDVRAALRESWLASEDGTHSYTGFMGRGGLAAVRDHGATPPSYPLAEQLDYLNHMRGLPTVLEWEKAA